jgi:hypothetical protein
MFLDIVMGRKNQVGLALTPQAVAVLDELADRTQLTRAEVVEAIAQARLQVLVDGAEWAFRLQPGDPQTQVEAVDPEAQTNQPKPAPEPVSPPVAAPTLPPQAQQDTAEVDRLQQEVTVLQAQLAEARSHMNQLKTDRQEQTPPASPDPKPEAAPAPTAVAPAAPAPTALLNADVVKGLQEQLLNTRAAYAELEAQLQQQQAENERLQQALLEAQQVAAIGASQLNRWQYKTFSR